MSLTFQICSRGWRRSARREMCVLFYSQGIRMEMYVFHMREWCLYHIIIIFLRDAASPAGDLAFLASKLKTKDSYSFGEKAERFFRLILDSLIFMLWLYEKKNVTLLMILHHGTISKRPVAAYFPNKSTVFENDRECLIQHCERSELRLLFEWTNGTFWRDFENLKLAVKQCYQTGQF